MMGFIGVSTAGDQKQPSPAIWGDCPNTLLTDKSKGYFGHEEFLGNIEVASFTDAAVFGSGLLDVDADTGALAPLTGQTGGYAKFTTGANDNDAIAVFTPPLGTITRNNNQKFWVEANLRFETLPDAGLFFGLTTEANATRDVVADNPSTSAVAGLTAATVVGFVTVETASAIAKINAVYAKTTGTPVTVTSDVLSSTAYIAGAGAAAPLAATTDVKLGIYFNGRTTLEFYVNGYKVGSQDVDSTLDQSTNLVAVLNYKTGTANARAVSVDWIRYAYQVRF
jgi:hypothetical protein